MIYNIKKRQDLVKIEKSALTTVRLKNLIKFVDKHKERVVKLLCKERLEDKFQQFMLVEQIPAICSKTCDQIFDRDDYNEVMKNVDKDEVNYDMVRFQTIQQYLGAIWIIFNIQKTPGPCQD